MKHRFVVPLFCGVVACSSGSDPGAPATGSTGGAVVLTGGVAQGGGQAASGGMVSGGGVLSGGALGSGGGMATGGQVSSGGQVVSGGGSSGNSLLDNVLVQLKEPMSPATEVVESCSEVGDMAPCSGSATPEFPGLSVCMDGHCQTLGCDSGSSCLPRAPYFPWPRPGQRDFTRSAGDEPIVQDNITTLMWQGCTAGLHGEQCELGTGVELSHIQTGREYCDGLVWGGHDDWILPDAYALISLLDMGMPRDPVTVTAEGGLIAGDYVESGHALPTDVFPRSEDTWLGSSTGRRTMSVNTATARVEDDVDDWDWPETVMCVRLTQAPSYFGRNERYQRIEPGNGEAVVFDRLTRTLWEPRHQGREFTEEEAVRHCMDLRWGGIEDWRLPGVKELFGVMDWDREFLEYDEDKLRAWSAHALSTAFGSSAYFASGAPRPVRCIYVPE